MTARAGAPLPPLPATVPGPAAPPAAQVAAPHATSDARPSNPWRRRLLTAGVLGALATVVGTLLTLLLVVPAALLLGPGQIGLLAVLTIALLGPVAEEAAKLGLLLGWGRRRRLAYRPEGWLALGVATGIGFAVVENLTYGLAFSATPGFAGLVMGLRTLTGLPVHALATGTAAYGAALLASGARPKARAGLALIAAGVLVHVANNGWAVLNVVGVLP